MHAAPGATGELLPGKRKTRPASASTRCNCRPQLRPQACHCKCGQWISGRPVSTLARSKCDPLPTRESGGRNLFGRASANCAVDLNSAEIAECLPQQAQEWSVQTRRAEDAVRTAPRGESLVKRGGPWPPVGTRADNVGLSASGHLHVWLRSPASPREAYSGQRRPPLKPRDTPEERNEACRDTRRQRGAEAITGDECRLRSRPPDAEQGECNPRWTRLAGALRCPSSLPSPVRSDCAF